MAERVVIDPITRIEGHLRMELETDGGAITNAWSQNTQFRGLEMIVKGRDPRDVWAFVQRICGVCTSVHAIASVVAVENAIGTRIPEQAQLIRDLVMASQNVQDHVIHFYHLHALDWVDVVSASQANPEDAVAFAKAIGSTWQGNSLERLTSVATTVKGLIASGQLSIFTGGYWGHPAYLLPPAANLMAVSHYLDALQFQRSMIRIATVFGGKNPHPNFLVGGMASSIDPSGSETVNQVQLDQVSDWINESVTFVKEVYYPDVLAIMGVYKDYFSIGACDPNFIAVGMAGATFAGDPADTQAGARSLLSPIQPGVLLDGDLKTVRPFDPRKIQEFVNSAWYSYEGGNSVGLTPDVGETTPKYTGPQPPYTWLADSSQYTWCKAPRYDGRVAQVGPQARVLLAYAQGHARTVELVDQAMAKIGFTLDQLNSTAGRVLCRAIESVTSAEMMADVVFPKFVSNIGNGNIDVFNGDKWEPSSWPAESSGYSLAEVPRGNLSHWVTIKDKVVERYQAVVPTTWNSGGRDPEGRMGPYEASLAKGGAHPLVDPARPVEPLRTIHSFDPCMSCAVHVLDPTGEQLTEPVTP